MDTTMEENIMKFEEKLKELVSLGKKKKSILEIQEINDFFSDMELEPDQMEKVFDYLEANNIDVLRIGADDDDDIDDVDISITYLTGIFCPTIPSFGSAL